MPTFRYREYDDHVVKITYATEEDTLAFANKVREAGGGDFLKALLPSVPEDSQACILARAFNFDCVVDFPSGEWVVSFKDQELANKIARSIGKKVKYREHEDHKYSVKLPARIGAVADVFDSLEECIDGKDHWPKKYIETYKHV